MNKDQFKDQLKNKIENAKERVKDAARPANERAKQAGSPVEQSPQSVRGEEIKKDVSRKIEESDDE